jgi:hypothetical protein
MMTPRQAIKNTALANSALATPPKVLAQTSASVPATAIPSCPFTLPALPYAYDALEQAIDAE